MAKRILSVFSLITDIVNQVNVRSNPVSLVKQSGIIPGGFPYSVFNGAAKLRPEGILSAIHSTRLETSSKSNLSPVSFLDLDKIDTNYFMFINAAKIDMDQRLYDISLCKAPLLFDSELEYIGKTSFQMKTTFYIENDSKPILTSRISTVFVCNKLRVPKPPPDWWIDLFGKHIKTEGQSFGKLEFSGEDESQSMESCFRVLPSDCDAYRHMNWGDYVKYCHDAVGDYMMEKHGDKGYEQFFSLCLKSLLLVYKKECSAGDKLYIRVSSEKNVSTNCAEDGTTFFLKINNDSKNVLFESKMEYYPIE